MTKWDDVDKTYDPIKDIINQLYSIEKRVKDLEFNYKKCCQGCRSEIDWLENRIKKLEGSAK